MKKLLVISLIVNVILIFLLWREEKKPPLERIVIEEKHPVSPSRNISVPSPGPLATSPVTKESHAPQQEKPTEDIGEAHIEVLVEKVGQDRMEFMTEKLKLGQKELDQIEKVKDDYMLKVQAIFPIGPGTELSVEQRRRMLELEVGRDQALARIMGKQKWEKFQKFRKTYNQEKFQEQFSEYGVVVPLDI